MPENVKCCELHVGDTVMCHGFTCRSEAPVVVEGTDKDPWVPCAYGKHHLDGQKEGDVYIGVEKIKK